MKIFGHHTSKPKRAAGLLVMAFCVFGLMTTSCRKKDGDRPGCTDSVADNYNPLANMDDGSCEYTTVEYTLWGQEAGFWGNDPFLQAVELVPCLGVVDTITLSQDTLGNTERAFFVMKDTNGSFRFAVTIINPVVAQDFKNGEVKMDVMLGDSSMVQTFETYIQGGSCGVFPTCSDICVSSPQTVSTAALNDSTFTTISIPINQYAARNLNQLQNALTISQTGVMTGNDTVLVIRNVKWSFNPNP